MKADNERKCPRCDFISDGKQCPRCGTELASDDKTLIFEDSNLRGGFTQIPNEVLKDGKLSPTARILYALLLSHAWQDKECFPGQDTLAEELGCTRKTVNQILTVLKRVGLISWKRRGQGKVNIYTIKTIPRRRYTESQKQAMAAKTILNHPVVAHRAEMMMGNRVVNKDGENVNWQTES